MAGLTASWAHGNAVVAEQPPGYENDGGAFGFGGLFSLNHFGWGTQIAMRPGFGSWFHIPIPTPVILDGKRMKLIRVFLQWSQIAGYAHSGSISDAHLWDGQTRVAAKSRLDFKDSGFATLPGHTTYELRQSRAWSFGVGLSFRLAAQSFRDGHFLEDRDAPVFVVGSAGADFEV